MAVGLESVIVLSGDQRCNTLPFTGAPKKRATLVKAALIISAALRWDYHFIIPHILFAFLG
jgi:hypothetical protein